MRLSRSLNFILTLWFVHRFPRTSKAIVLLAALALLVGMVWSAVSK